MERLVAEHLKSYLLFLSPSVLPIWHRNLSIVQLSRHFAQSSVQVFLMVSFNAVAFCIVPAT